MRRQTHGVSDRVRLCVSSDLSKTSLRKLTSKSMLTVSSRTPRHCEQDVLGPTHPSMQGSLPAALA
eukprot:2750274-Pleurochrysis_carterae.AAC.2